MSANSRFTKINAFGTPSAYTPNSIAKSLSTTPSSPFTTVEGTVVLTQTTANNPSQIYHTGIVLPINATITSVSITGNDSVGPISTVGGITMVHGGGAFNTYSLDLSSTEAGGALTSLTPPQTAGPFSTAGGVLGTNLNVGRYDGSPVKVDHAYVSLTVAVIDPADQSKNDSGSMNVKVTYYTL
jgi:hypothetical protein